MSENEKEEVETYKYWYGSVHGALALLAINAKNSAKIRGARGREEASEYDISKDFLKDIWTKQYGKCYYSEIPMKIPKPKI